MRAYPSFRRQLIRPAVGPPTTVSPSESPP